MPSIDPGELRQLGDRLDSLVIQYRGEAFCGQPRSVLEITNHLLDSLDDATIEPQARRAANLRSLLALVAAIAIQRLVVPDPSAPAVVTTTPLNFDESNEELGRFIELIAREAPPQPTVQWESTLELVTEGVKVHPGYLDRILRIAVVAFMRLADQWAPKVPDADALRAAENRRRDQEWIDSLMTDSNDDG